MKMPHYLDTSALVKLLVDEDGCAKMRCYFQENTVFYTTSICFVETLGALKGKYERKLITQDQYLKACNNLMAYISEEAIGIDEIGISDRRTFREVERVAKNYNLDIADALQIVTLKKVDEELFAVLQRLTEAPGAGALIEKNLKQVGEDPELAALIDGFVIVLLDTCGDPTKLE